MITQLDVGPKNHVSEIFTPGKTFVVQVCASDCDRDEREAICKCMITHAYHMIWHLELFEPLAIHKCTITDVVHIVAKAKLTNW